MKKLFIVVSILISFTIEAQKPYEDYLPEPQIEFNPKKYVCYRSEKPLTIDGKMTENSWQKADWTDFFIDIEGNSKPEPYFQTRVKMLWDDDYFYFGCEMEEPHIWAKLKERDSVIFYDNDFEIFIDPDGDTHNYYELEMNAFNTVWDLFLSKPYRDQGCKVLDSWDIQGLKSAVYIDGTLNDPSDIDKGWSVEVAIPWKVLEECTNSCPPKQGKQWRANFSRVQWETEIIDGKYEKIEGKREHNWVWSPQGLINMHYPEMWGFVQFSNKIVGIGKDEFIWNPAEDAKWILRQIYYKERTYFFQNGKFADNIEDPELDIMEVKGYLWPPEIFTTPTFFKVILTSSNKIDKFHISYDGRSW